jgi:drug/metabolite transporter (DMT)-like permease
MKSKVGLGAVYLMAAASLWGGSQVISKIIMKDIQPMTLTLCRFVLAALLLGCIALYNKSVRVEWKDIWRLALLGLCGYTISIGCQLMGLKLSSAHIGTMITSTPPIFMLLFSTIFFHEKVTFQKILALFTAGVGVFLMVGVNRGEPGELAGNLLLATAAISWALYSVYGKFLIRKYNSITVTFWSLCFGTVFTFPLCWRESAAAGFSFTERLSVWLGIGYVGLIATAIGFCLWNKGIELFDSSSAGLFLFVQPLFGSLLASIFLHEQIRPVFFISSLLIIIGIGLSVIVVPHPFWMGRYKKML